MIGAIILNLLANTRKLKKQEANCNTHCQGTQADTQAKTWQRVCLFPHSKDGQSTRKSEGQHPTAVWCNGGYSASYASF